MTEYEKMLSGEIYNAVDPSLLKDLYACSELCWEYNQIRPTDFKARNEKLKQILGGADDDTFINPPFHCDYGKHIKVGRRFFANFNFVVLDEAPVTIGDDVFIGPNVGIYTACHSTDPKERNTREEWAKPVTIGRNCWIGGNVTILPGVTIGEGSTIGAGSVVVKDLPIASLWAIRVSSSRNLKINHQRGPLNKNMHSYGRYEYLSIFPFLSIIAYRCVRGSIRRSN